MTGPQTPDASWSRRWLLRAIVGGMVLGAILSFAPTIVARTPLLAMLVSWAARDVRGTVVVGGARLSWFHKPVLYDVEVRDSQGGLVAAASRVELSHSLVQLAWDPRHLGTVVLHQPEVHWTAVGNDSNVEQVLAAFIEGEPTSRYRTGVSLVIHNGTLLLSDEDIRERWLVEDVAATIEIPCDRRAAIEVDCTGHTDVEGKPAAQKVHIGYRTGNGGPGLPPQIVVEVNTEGMPAAAIATFLRRVEPGLQFQGIVSGHLAATWHDERPEQPSFILKGEVSGRRTGVFWPSLSREMVPLGTLHCPINLVWSRGQIQSEDTRFQSGLGDIRLTGNLDLRGDPLAVLHQSGIRLAADVDLAILARWLSKPLQLRDDLRITEGRLTGEVRSESKSDGVAWTGRVTAAGLRGERSGQRLVWENPIRIELAAHQAAIGLPRIERFVAQTDFGTFHAAGTEDELTIDGKLEIALLWERLRQFIELGDDAPRGSLTGRMTLTRDRTGTFRLVAAARVRDGSYSGFGMPWREPDFEIHAEGRGSVKSDFCRVDSGQIVLAAGGDSLRIELLEPITDLWSGSFGTSQVRIRGDVGRWLQRVTPLVGQGSDLQAAGVIEGQARFRIDRATVRADQLEININNLRFAGFGLTVVEPNVYLRAERLQWQRESNTRHLEVTELTWTSPALAFSLPSLRGEGDREAPLKLSGRGAVRGDLARLQRWLPLAFDEPWSGSLEGSVQISADHSLLRLQADATLRQVVLGTPAAPTWVEPLVRLAVRAVFDPANDQLTLEDGKVESSGLAVSLSGNVAAVSTGRDFRISGSLLYDWDRLEPQLRRLTGLDLRMTGKDQRPYRLEGSLGSRKTRSTATAASMSSVAANWKGEWSIGWQSMQVLGCSIGSVVLQARMLGDGWVRFTPVETTLNRGTLRLEPFIKLDEPKPLLMLGKNTRLDRAQITAGVSNSSLGYAAPALSGLRDPLGEFSVMVEGARIPLTEMKQADAWGQVTIHSIKATPGPLLTEITRALKLPVGLQMTKEQTIPVRLVQGRVHHQNLEIPLGDISLKTSGSVGLDGSLQVMAEFPAPSRWLGKNTPKALTVVRLPIGGTISTPRIDPQALQQIVSRYAVETAGELLKREFEKNIPKWFQGPPKK